MAMFPKKHGGSPFSDLLRSHGNGNKKTPVMHSSSGTSSVGKLKGKAPHPSKNPGGVAVGAVHPRSIPSSSAHMDGKSHPVPRGGGQSHVGSQNRTPPKGPLHNRLGNFGEPAGHATKGSDTPFGGRENPREHRSMPANMKGKAHPVRGGRKSKPAFEIGDSHHNHGSPKVGGHPRKIGGMRSRDLAAHL